jgi:hypothetical protein
LSRGSCKFKERLARGLKDERSTPAGGANVATIAAVAGIFAFAKSGLFDWLNNVLIVVWLHKDPEPLTVPFWEIMVFAAVLAIIGLACVLCLGAPRKRG